MEITTTGVVEEEAQFITLTQVMEEMAALVAAEAEPTMELEEPLLKTQELMAVAQLVDLLVVPVVQILAAAAVVLFMKTIVEQVMEVLEVLES